MLVIKFGITWSQDFAIFCPSPKSTLSSRATLLTLPQQSSGDMLPESTGDMSSGDMVPAASDAVAHPIGDAHAIIRDHPCPELPQAGLIIDAWHLTRQVAATSSGFCPSPSARRLLLSLLPPVACFFRPSPAAEGWMQHTHLARQSPIVWRILEWNTALQHAGAANLGWHCDFHATAEPEVMPSEAS